MNNKERSLAEEINEGFEALKRIHELEAECDRLYRIIELNGALVEAKQEETDELKTAVRSFFEDFLNVREESDSGRVFAPITLSSSRCMMTDPLCDILQKMRKLSGAADAPKRESWDERSDNERCNGK